MELETRWDNEEEILIVREPLTGAEAGFHDEDSVSNHCTARAFSVPSGPRKLVPDEVWEAAENWFAADRPAPVSRY